MGALVGGLVEPLVGQISLSPAPCVAEYGWYCPGVRRQIWVCWICVISHYSNGAVKIQVGVELADFLSPFPMPMLETL